MQVRDGSSKPIEESVEVIWSEIRNYRSQELAKQDDDYWMAPSRSAGLQKVDVLLVVRDSPIIHDFFHEALFPKLPTKPSEAPLDFQVGPRP